MHLIIEVKWQVRNWCAALHTSQYWFVSVSFLLLDFNLLRFAYIIKTVYLFDPQYQWNFRIALLIFCWVFFCLFSLPVSFHDEQIHSILFFVNNHWSSYDPKWKKRPDNRRNEIQKEAIQLIIQYFIFFRHWCTLHIGCFF